MGPVAAAVPYIGPAISIMGALTSAGGATQGANTAQTGADLAAQAAIDQGDAQRAEANYEAGQLRVNAIEQIAAGQRGAMEVNRQGTLLDSRIGAVAAASGGGSNDVSVVMYRATMAGDTAYQAALKVYGGEEAARGMNNQAAATEYGGYIAQKGAYARATGYKIQGQTAQIQGQAQADSSILGAAGSLFSKFGMGGASAGAAAGADVAAAGSGAILDTGISALSAFA